MLPSEAKKFNSFTNNIYNMYRKKKLLIRLTYVQYITHSGIPFKLRRKLYEWQENEKNANSLRFHVKILLSFNLILMNLKTR